MAAQDMPPPGGFASIPIERTFPKPLIRQSIFMLGCIVLSINGMFYIAEWKKRYRILKIEQQEHYIATAPFLWAEQDRKFLKVMKNLRRDEEYVMQGVPGWSAGTLFGEPIYKTGPKDKIQGPSIDEWIVGRSRGEWTRKVIVPDWYK